MRSCIRCRCEMTQDLLPVTTGGYEIAFQEKGIFKRSLGKLRCAVCPDCGYTEFYTENTEKLRKAMAKDL